LHCNPKKFETSPNSNKYFNTFCTRKPAIMDIVVGKLAAQTPSFFNIFSSSPLEIIKGGAH